MLIGTVTPRGWEDTPGGGKGRDGCERGGALNIIQSTSVLWHTGVCCGTQCTWKTKAGEGMGVLFKDDDARISSSSLASLKSPPNPPAQFHFTAGMKSQQ